MIIFNFSPHNIYENIKEQGQEIQIQEILFYGISNFENMLSEQGIYLL